ncbi:precorrin-8X methylmutase, partial [Klebsiella pneumoniae]
AVGGGGGVPVGFVGAAESKAAISERGRPAIAALGRKGGSNVAAAIVNALLYHLREAQ